MNIPPVTSPAPRTAPAIIARGRAFFRLIGTRKLGRLALMYRLSWGSSGPTLLQHASHARENLLDGPACVYADDRARFWMSRLPLRSAELRKRQADALVESRVRPLDAVVSAPARDASQPFISRQGQQHREIG